MTRFFQIFAAVTLFCLPLAGQTQTLVGKFERTGVDGSSTGLLLIYPDSDSTALVYIEVTRGAPSYNSGSIYSRINLTNGPLTLRSIDSYFACKLELTVKGDLVTIRSIDSDCGFGGGVSADGIFKRTGAAKPEFFTTMEGDKIYFSETSPEEYNR